MPTYGMPFSFEVVYYSIMKPMYHYPSPPLHLAVAAVLSIAILFSCTSTPAVKESGTPPVRVCLDNEHESARIYLDKDAFLIGDGQKAVIRSEAVYECAVTESGRILVMNGAERVGEFAGQVRCWYPDPKQRFGFEGNRYSDTIVLASGGKKLFVLNVLPVERYLESVVPNEIGRNLTEKELSAARAQAIIARTYVLARIDLPLKKLFHVYDDTRDQVFTGMMNRTRITSRAVRETSGQVMMDGDRYAECFFHAACGGRTEAATGAWPGHEPRPYLAGVADRGPHGDYCRNAGSYRWTERYTRDELESILRASIPTAWPEYPASVMRGDMKLLDIQIKERTASGRVRELRIYMGKPSKYETFTLQGDKIRRALRRPDAKSILRSTLFDITLERDAQNWITAIRIDGGGNGHGVGMCQWGAIERAREGAGADEILRAYFPETAVSEVY